MNKKGFTFIELLAVITILSVISLIAVISVSKYISKSKNQAYQSIEESMRIAAQNYVLKTRPTFSTSASGKTLTLTTKTLVHDGYLQQIIDPASKKACKGYSYVTITKTKVSASGKDASISDMNEKTRYDVCLICEDYISDTCKDKLQILVNFDDGSPVGNELRIFPDRATVLNLKFINSSFKNFLAYEMSGDCDWVGINEDSESKQLTIRQNERTNQPEGECYLSIHDNDTGESKIEKKVKLIKE